MPPPKSMRPPIRRARTIATIPNAFTHRGVPPEADLGGESAMWLFLSLSLSLCWFWTLRQRNRFARHRVLASDAASWQRQVAYPEVMPKLWSETIDAHRRTVRDATLDSAAALVAERGLRSVTMSQIAEETGIGRATLYKYFPDVEAILVAWHERQITAHIGYLAELRDQPGDICERLEAVLEAYALIHHEHHGTELAALLHRGEHIPRAQKHLTDFIRDMLSEGVKTGDLRDDVAAGELAGYCLHALTAAGSLRSKVAVRRLVMVTLDGLRLEGKVGAAERD